MLPELFDAAVAHGIVLPSFRTVIGPGRKVADLQQRRRRSALVRAGHDLVYRSGDQLMAVSYSVKGDTFVAEKPPGSIAKLGGAKWDLAPDGKRVAVLIPEGTAQAPAARTRDRHAPELRRRTAAARAASVESGPMPLRDIHRAALTSIIAAAITLGPALDAGQTGVQSVQYRSPEGVEYRSLPDTDAVKSARAALEANPKNIAKHHRPRRGPVRCAAVSRSHRDVHTRARDRADERAAPPMARASISVRA